MIFASLFTAPAGPPEKFARLRELFDRIAELPAERRESAVAEAAGGDVELASELRRLLEFADVSRSPLDTPVALGSELALSLQGAPNLPGFAVDGVLGRGGSATVYVARQERAGFSRRVALKVIDRFVDPESLRRVQEEQRILANLEHPGIARLYDAGLTPSGQPYLAMEQVEGSDLVACCRQRNLPVRDRLSLFLQVVEAVSYAHERSIVHRDLKPANILVTEAGEAKLLDFGIAKLLAAPGEDEETRTLRPAMTPAYASPEQVRGDRITQASDLYSLGVVLYELLADTLPYRLAEPGSLTLQDAIRSQEPEAPSAAYWRTHRTTATTGGERFEILRRRRSLRGDLDAVVLKALRKDPNDRYRSVAEFGADLRRVLAGEPVTARRDYTYRLRAFLRRRRAALLGGLLTGALLGGGWWIRQRPPGAIDPALFPFLDVQLRSAQLDTELRQALALRERHQGEDAAAILERVIARRPRVAMLRAALADSLALAGLADRAKAAALEAERLSAGLPQEARLLIEAIALREKGDSAEASRRLRSLHLLLPENRELGLLLANALLDNAEAKEALALVERFETRSPAAIDADPRWAMARLWALSDLGRQRDMVATGRALGERWAAAGFSAVAARVFMLEGQAWEQLGDVQKAKESLALLRVEAERSGELRPRLITHQLSSLIAVREARHAEVDAQCRAGLELARQMGSPRSVCVLLNVLGVSQRRRGELHAARETLSEALQTAEEAGLHSLAPRYRHNLANVELNLGHYAAAEREFRAVAELRRTSGDERGLVISLRGLAEALFFRGRLRDVDLVLAEAEPLARKIQGRDLARVLHSRGELAAARAQDGPARAYFEEAMAIQTAAGEADAGPALGVALVQAMPAPGLGDCALQERSAIALGKLDDARITSALAAAAQCWVAVGRAGRAADAHRRALLALKASEEPSARLDVEVAGVAVAIAQRRFAPAQSAIDRLVAECRELDYGTMLFDLRLLQARLAMVRGDAPARVRAVLESLRDDARALWFERIALEAESLMSGTGRSAA